jgi:hypothetical protein
MLQFIRQNNKLIAVLNDIEENMYNPDTAIQLLRFSQFPATAYQSMYNLSPDEVVARKAAIVDMEVEGRPCLL